MLSSLQINKINTQLNEKYPITAVANKPGTFQCGSLYCHYEHNVWVIVTRDDEEELASVLYKPYAFALMRIAHAFYTLAPNEQRSLRENIAPDLMQYIEAKHEAKPKHAGGRPRTGRKYKQYWINEEEDAAIKALLAEMRSKDKNSEK